MEPIEDDVDEETLGIDTEEDLDLVVVDAEIIKGMIRTQGTIMSHLDNIYGALLVLGTELNELKGEVGDVGDLTDATTDLANAFKEFIKLMKRRKCLASSVKQSTGKKGKRIG